MIHSKNYMKKERNAKGGHWFIKDTDNLKLDE